LERRRLTPQEINLAIELLRGDTKRKVELILGLATSGINNPRPWYVWMAQDEDREVRRVAIHALGGMRDPEVAGILRELLLRESDPEVEQTLRRILSEAGR
jgi:HEAT repeat protein